MTMYLALKTDQAEVELYLLTSDGEIAKQKIWLADRELARDLPGEIDALLGGKYEELKGIIVFKGSGSFTGLRIGAAVANAIAYAQQINIVGTTGDEWRNSGVRRLQAGDDDKIVLPTYGARPHITSVKK